MPALLIFYYDRFRCIFWVTFYYTFHDKLVSYPYIATISICHYTRMHILRMTKLTLKYSRDVSTLHEDL